MADDVEQAKSEAPDQIVRCGAGQKDRDQEDGDDGERTGPRAGKDMDVNDRSCIVSRERLEPEHLIRFVLGPDGSVVPDLKRKLPGRGAHVALSREAVDAAAKRKLFARAFKTKTSGPDDLGALVDDLLVKSALGGLGIARKAGQLVTGATKVDGAIRTGRALLVVQARDAAPDGVRKMDAARRAAAYASYEPMTPVDRQLTADELGLAFGGGNVIHAAILAGKAGAAAAKRLAALATYRGEGSASGPGIALQ